MAKTKHHPIKVQGKYRLDTWLTRHLQVMLSSLGRMARDPLNSLMTVSVIAIALALPAGLHLLVSNVQTLSHHWDGSASISAFLQPEVTDEKAQQLVRDWNTDPSIESLEYISPAEALDEFKQRSGFGDALALLSTNPLPGVIVIKPTPEHSDAAGTEILGQRLQSHPDVDLVQVDLQWVKRLQGITHIVERAVLVLGALLAAAVLLIVGNTIRLEIQNRHTEIEVIKLVGGTRAFVRRPFLYTGFWYGFSGGLIALVLVISGVTLISGPVQHLAGLYASDFALETAFLWLSPAIILGGGGLGLAGAWIAASRHLNAIEPGKSH
ncbi:MAG: permease-like cell division protein FtsX [bacterium]